jgi:hypothetical protein
LLGNAGYDAYHSYYQVSNVLVLVTDLPNFTLAGTDPLTVSQDEQLTQIMAAASTRDKYGYAIYGTVDWSTVMPQAQALLEPAQYEALQSLQAQKTTYWQMMKLTNPQFGTAAWHP